MVKLIGGIAVLSSCGGLGFYFAGEMERRIRELKELRNIFLLLRGDIRYLKSSFPEAFTSVARKNSGVFGAFFGRISDSLSECMFGSLEEAFVKAAKETLGGSALKKQDILLLNQLGGMLGQMDTDMQINALDWYLEQLTEVIKTLTQEAGQKATLTKSLGVLAGIFLLIILV